jgi:hypothetical protein
MVQEAAGTRPPRILVFAPCKRESRSRYPISTSHSTLQQLMKALMCNDQDALKSLTRTGKALDRVREALKAYLTQPGTDGLSETDTQRHASRSILRSIWDTQAISSSGAWRMPRCAKQSAA